MSLISPTRTSYDKEIEILEKVGIPTRKTDKIEDDFINLMGGVGLSKEEVLGAISQIMNAGSSDSVKLTAAKTALQIYMHPAFVPRKEMDRAERPIINFNISGGDVKMQAILTPSSTDPEERNF